jgi:hypothetical protein
MHSRTPVIDITGLPLGDLLRGRTHMNLTVIADYMELPLGTFLSNCRRETLRARGEVKLITDLEHEFACLRVTWP